MSFGALSGAGRSGNGPGNEAAPSHGGATGPRAESCRGLSAGAGGFAATVPGEDAAGGEGRFRRQVGARIPTGEGPTRTVCGARPPRGEGPRARDAYTGVIPTGGGTRLTRHSGRGPIARGDDEASKRIIHGPPALGDP